MNIGQIVYHRADEMQEPRIITGIVKRPDGIITYLVGHKDGESECYDMELNEEKKIFL